MRDEEEIKRLFEKFRALTEGIVEGQDTFDKYKEDERFGRVCDASDVLDWVLEDISTKDFLSEAYLGFESLKEEFDQEQREVPTSEDRIRDFLVDIIEDDRLSLLASGPMETIKETLKKAHYEINYEDMKNIYEDIYEENNAPELAKLINTMKERKDDILDYIEGKRNMKSDREHKKELIEETREEISGVDLTTNEQLLDRQIEVLTFDFSDEDLVLCRIGRERFGFHPSWQQKQQVRSWSVKGTEWPLKTRILQKGNVYVFERTW